MLSRCFGGGNSEFEISPMRNFSHHDGAIPTQSNEHQFGGASKFYFFPFVFLPPKFPNSVSQLNGNVSQLDWNSIRKNSGLAALHPPPLKFNHGNLSCKSSFRCWRRERAELFYELSNRYKRGNLPCHYEANTVQCTDLLHTSTMWLFFDFEYFERKSFCQKSNFNIGNFLGSFTLLSKTRAFFAQL